MQIWMINLVIGVVFGLFFGALAVNTMNRFFIDGEDGQEGAEIRKRWLIVIIFMLICVGCSFLGFTGLAVILVALTIFSLFNREGEYVGTVLLLAGLPFVFLMIAKIIEKISAGGFHWSVLFWLIPVLIFVLCDLTKSHFIEMKELRELEIEEATGEKPKRDWIPELFGAIVVIAAIIAAFVFISERGWFA